MYTLSQQFKRVMTGVLLGLMLTVPNASYAATWQPRTNAELIAFLYGVVVQLQAQLDALRANPDYYEDNYDDEDEDDDDSSTTSGRPQVSTGDADDITANSATVTTDVDMRSYGYGNVFFVYGTSRSDVSGVTREDSFADIEVDEDMNRSSINNSFSGKAELVSGLYGLTAATEYHYRACVEYIDDSDDTNLTCGDVESFTTKRR